MKVQELIRELQKFPSETESRFTPENAARSSRYIKPTFILAAQSPQA